MVTIKNLQRLDNNGITTNCSYALLSGVYYNKDGFRLATNAITDIPPVYNPEKYVYGKESMPSKRTFVKYGSQVKKINNISSTTNIKVKTGTKEKSVYEEIAKVSATPVKPVAEIKFLVVNNKKEDKKNLNVTKNNLKKPTNTIVKKSKIVKSTDKPHYESIHISGWVNYSNTTKKLTSKNFGDDINFSFLPGITGSEHILCKTNTYKLRNYLMIGSVLTDKFINGLTEIWGSGMLKKQLLKTKPFNVNAVRGPLTRNVLIESGINCPEVYGDPALLIPYYYYPYVLKKYKLGIIPHHSHIKSELVDKFRNIDGVVVIDFTSYTDWKQIIKQIVACEFIVSESLHGLIISEAYKIPNIWISFGNIGQDFKYKDYFMSVGKTPYEATKINDNTTIENLLELKKQYDSTFTLDLKKLVDACPIKLQGLNLAHNIKPYTGKVLLCCIGKMENNYIKEFVEYHKQLGFDNICLYDNNDVNGEKFEDVIDEYIDGGFVILKNWRGKKLALIPAYTDCYMTYKDDYDWIAYIDIDEFIHLDDDTTIKDFLSRDIYNIRGINTIRICWKLYTDSGLIKTNGNYSIKRFTDITTKIWTKELTKIIVKTILPTLTFTSPHGALKDKNVICVNTAGKLVKNNTTIGNDWTWKNACLNHYRFKTIEEFVLNKMVRLWPTTYLNGGKKGLNLDLFFRFNTKTPEKVKYAEYLLDKYNISRNE